MSSFDRRNTDAVLGAEERLAGGARRLRRWGFVHKWSSLVCTAFLLMICLTGLPLLFSDEIDHWLEPHAYETLPPETPAVNLDRVTATGRRMYPGQVVTSIFIDDDEPQIYLWMAPSWEAAKADRASEHFIRFDARTAKILEQSEPASERRPTFMGVMLSLHRDLFAGLAGELFLGLMAIFFVIAIVSGMVLYGPFSRKLGFGTVRRDRSARLKWLDLHNLLGVVTLAWALVVGATGTDERTIDPRFSRSGRRRMCGPCSNLGAAKPPPLPSELSSVQAAFDTARSAVPGMTVTSIGFPSEEGSPHHYVLWAKGATPLTSRLFNPVIVDARTGIFTAVVKMPWYLRALEVSRPLHFGDYGGLPLKIIWTLLDLVTIAVLGSGLYLWLSRRQSPIERRLGEFDSSAIGGG